uniref:ADP-ribosylation factor-like protein 3 n=1 Tax=Strigamia maritima TaxID=126957 RepID=T1IQJ5_STRMM
MFSLMRNFPPWIKTVLVVGGGVLIGISTYGLLIYYERRHQGFQDEGFEDTSKVEEQPERKVIVLGLDGVGKSTFIANLSKVDNVQNDIKPTEGFHIMSVNTQGTAINIWEIGGAETYRNYWGNFLQDTDALVFVVDSNDSKRLPQAYDEFKKLIADDRLKDVPILVLANKQDIPECLSCKQIEDALNLKSISPKLHKIKVLPLQISTNKPQHQSLKIAEDTMIQFAFTK